MGAGVTGADDGAPVTPLRGSGARRRPPYVLRAAPARPRGSMYRRIGSSCGVVAGTLGGVRSTRRKIGSSSGCGTGAGGGRRAGTALPLDGALTGAGGSAAGAEKALAGDGVPNSDGAG